MPSLTARENVSLVTEIARAPMTPDEALARVGLEKRMDHFPAQMSGGEQQRVAIARAIAKRPNVLLCDEPTGALDSQTGVTVLEALTEVNTDLGTTTVIITHNADIQRIAHRVLLMADGRIVDEKVNANRVQALRGVVVSALDTKLLRDLGRLWAQALAIALVAAAGVMTLLVGMGTYRSLYDTREAYYDRYAFADIFASAIRAPASLVDRILAIPGVSQVDTRVQSSAVLDIEGLSEPASGLVLSIPDHGEPMLNRLVLIDGALPEPGEPDTVVISQAFADASAFKPGDRFAATMGGVTQDADHFGHRAVAGIHLLDRPGRNRSRQPAFRHPVDALCRGGGDLRPRRRLQLGDR